MIAAVSGDVAANVLQVVVAVATAIAAFAAWRATRLTERTSTGALLHARKLSTVEHLSARAERYRELREEIGELGDAIREDQWRCLLKLMGIWEHTAAGVNSGVFDVEVLNRMTGGNLLGTYQQYARFVRLRRRENPRIYDQLEILVDKLLMIEVCCYEVTKQSIGQLRELGMDGTVLKGLKDLGGRTWTYHEFVAELVRRQLEGDKVLIMSCTRKATVVIRPYEARDREEAVALFESIQQETEGGYPPAVRTESVGGVAAWLDLPPTHTRLVLETEAGIGGYVELENPEVDPPDADDEYKATRHAYWKRAFQDHERFQNDPTLSLDRLIVIKRLGVHPAHQRRGLGRLLLRHAIQVVQFDYGRVAALVVLSYLQPSIHLYDAEGATRIGTFPGHVGDELTSYVF